MALFKYIFFLGIVLIIFSMIWGFFMILYRLLTGMAERPAIEKYLVKALNMYILVSLCAMKTLEYVALPGTPDVLIILTGIFVLYFYLTGRMERQKFTLQINSQAVRLDKVDLRWESSIMLASLVFFSFAIRYPQLTHNEMNLWFYTSVMEIYNTAVIGWIFGLFGVFFLLLMVFRGIFVTAALLNRLMDFLSGNNRNKKDKNKDDDNSDYTDYEIIE